MVVSKVLLLSPEIVGDGPFALLTQGPWDAMSPNESWQEYLSAPTLAELLTKFGERLAEVCDEDVDSVAACLLDPGDAGYWNASPSLVKDLGSIAASGHRLAAWYFEDHGHEFHTVPNPEYHAQIAEQCPTLEWVAAWSLGGLAGSDHFESFAIMRARFSSASRDP